jgi:uncharacterized protein YbaR (Trm112 family)
MTLHWINDFLPTLRCPDTHQPLRWATPEDLERHASPPDTQALAREDGTRLFPIDAGIPILLPEA